MNWRPWFEPASILAGLAILVGVWQWITSIRASHANSAHQAHQDYLRLCFENPEFSSTEQFLRCHSGERLDHLVQERSRTAVKYLWFLSLMLNSLERILEFVSARGEWRRLAVDQVRYHHGAIAEVWGEWRVHYAGILIDIVDDALREGPFPNTEQMPSAERSPAARAELERVGTQRSFRETVLVWVRAQRGIWAALWITGFALLAWMAAALFTPASDVARPTTTDPATATATTTATATATATDLPGVAQAGQGCSCSDAAFASWPVLLLAILVAGLFVFALWRRYRPKTAVGKVGLASTFVPATATMWDWIKPQLTIELSDSLHNVAAFGVTGLLVLTATVLIVGFWNGASLKWPRLVVAIVLGALPLAIFGFPALRADFLAALTVDGRIEAFYVAGLFCVTYVLGLLPATIASVLRLFKAQPTR